MAKFNKKNITLLLAFIVSLVPTIADNTKDSADTNEETTTKYELIYQYKHPAKGKLALKVRIPLNIDFAIHYCLCIEGIGDVNPLYSIIDTFPSNGGARKIEKKFILSKDDFLDVEKVIGYVKGFVKEFYIEQKDETGTQSRKIGIFGNCCDGDQTIGIGFETREISANIDFEGIIRSLLYKAPQYSDEPDPYTENSSGYGALKLNWYNISHFKKITCAIKIAKGDFTSLGAKQNNNGFNVFKYFDSAIASFEMEELIFDMISKFTIGYTHLKDSVERPNPNNPSQKTKLRIIPKAMLNIECVDLEIFGEMAKMDITFEYAFCDISQKYYKKPAKEGIKEPSHFLVSFKLKFNDIFDEKDLTFAPKVAFLWAPDHKKEWAIDKYRQFGWRLSFEVEKKIKLVEYYSL